MGGGVSLPLPPHADVVVMARVMARLIVMVRARASVGVVAGFGVAMGVFAWVWGMSCPGGLLYVLKALGCKQGIGW